MESPSRTTTFLRCSSQIPKRTFGNSGGTVGDLGTTDSRNRFKPHTEPSGFQTHDGPSLKAAEEIVRGYVTASTSIPDFKEIREKYDLPDPDEVSRLLF